MIVLTALATIAGVTPLILEQSVQAQFVVSLTGSLASGVLFATAVTLVLVPTLYLVLDDVQRRGRSLLRRR